MSYSLFNRLPFFYLCRRDCLFLILTALVSAVFISPLTGQTRGAWERFSAETNAQSWTVYEDGQGYFPEWYNEEGDEDGRSLYWLISGDLDCSFSSYDASGGAFSGNYSAQRIAGLILWLEVENSANLSFVDVSIWSEITSTWYYSETMAPVDGWQEWEVDFRDQWWTWNGTDYIPAELSPEVLSDISEININFMPSSPAADGEYVSIDDVRLVPELIVPSLAVSRAGAMLDLFFTQQQGQIYTVQRSTTNLSVEAFIDWPGHDDLTGTGVYLLSESLTAPSHFYRVSTDVYFEGIADLEP